MSAPSTAPTRLASIKDALFAPLALVAVILAFVLWQQRAEIRRLTAEAPRTAAQADAAVRTARARRVLLVPPRPLAPMPDEMRSLDEANSLGPAGDARAVKARPAGGDSLGRLLNDPEFIRALALQRQAGLDARFAGLFRQLALGDAQLAAFKRLLAEKENVALDVVAVSETQLEGPLSPGQLNAGIVAARAQVDAAIRASLGEERYSVYCEYERSLPQRALVAQLEQRLSYSPAPLAAAQAESLVRILVSHVLAPAAGAPRPATVVVDADDSTGARGVTLDSAPATITEIAVTDSQAVLAPRQVAALREIQVEQQASQRALQLLRETLPAGDHRPGVGLQLVLQ